jgi:hypothetical protein
MQAVSSMPNLRARHVVVTRVPLNMKDLWRAFVNMVMNIFLP